MKNSRNVDTLMDAAVGLADEIPRIIHEVIPELVQEKIARDDCFCLAQLSLCSLKVKFHVELLEESSDGILILVLLHLDDLDDLTDRMPDS